MKARIYLFPPGHGGRAGCYTGSRARVGLKFPHNAKDGQFGCEMRAAQDEIPLGEFLLVDIVVMNLADAKEFIREGGDFGVFEGARLIGVGLWEDLRE